MRDKKTKRYLVGSPVTTEPRLAIHAVSIDETAIAYFKLNPRQSSFSVCTTAGGEKDYFFSDVEKILPDASQYLHLAEAAKNDLKKATWDEFHISLVEKDEHNKLLSKLSTIGVIGLGLAILFGRYLFRSFLNGDLSFFGTE